MDKNGFFNSPDQLRMRQEIQRIDAEARAAGIPEAQLETIKQRLAAGEVNAHMSRAHKKASYKMNRRRFGGKHHRARCLRAAARGNKPRQAQRG